MRWVGRAIRGQVRGVRGRPVTCGIPTVREVGMEAPLSYNVGFSLLHGHLAMMEGGAARAGNAMMGPFFSPL